MRRTYIARQFLVVLHHLFVLLVDGQNFADAVCGGFGLSEKSWMSSEDSEGGLLQNKSFYET